MAKKEEPTDAEILDVIIPVLVEARKAHVRHLDAGVMAKDALRKKWPNMSIKTARAKVMRLRNIWAQAVLYWSFCAIAENRHMKDIDIYRSAKLYLDQYGADAPIMAGTRADQMLERGDLHGVAVWKRIVRAIEEILASEGQTKH